MDNILKTISAEFVELLKEREIPQHRVALDLQMSKGNVSKLYAGQRNFTLDNISTLGCLYNIPVSGMIARHIGKTTDPKKLELIDLIVNSEADTLTLLSMLQALDEKQAS